MRTWRSDLAAYLREVFWDGLQWLFLLFDALGILTFFSPTFSDVLAAHAIITRTAGFLLLVVSLLVANFRLHQRYARTDLLTEDSLLLYPHHSGRGNAVKMAYAGDRLAKDLSVVVSFTNESGEKRNLTVDQFHAREDEEMKHRPHKYDFLEPGQIAYFRLPWRKDTSTGSATVCAGFTDTKYPKRVYVRKEFELTDGELADIEEFGWI